MYGLPMLSVAWPHTIESMDGFQNQDDDDSWQHYAPDWEWTDSDLAEFEHELLVEENERLAMAAWWEMEGVRCWTYGPPTNPYAE